jgi:hypothetical protein
VTVIHDAELAAVHTQPVADVTETVPVRVPDVTDRLVGEIVYVHPAACEMSNVCPPIVSAAVRGVAVLLVAIE